jgi:membrane protein implicated in regulation of membrane protease activity
VQRALSGGKVSRVIHEWREHFMVILGLILLIIGLIAGIGILTIIGAILLVVGLILNFVPIGGTRRRYY